MIERRRAYSGSRSRRAFLLRAAGTLVAPVALSACARRESKPSAASPEAPGPEKAEETASATAAGRPPIPVGEPIVRVRVLRVRNVAEIVRIGAGGRWIELASPDDDLLRDIPASVAPVTVVHREPLEIAIGPGGWSILDAYGFRPSVRGLQVLELRPLPQDRASFVTVQGRAYPGCVRLVPRSDITPGAYDVINHVAVESYLPGVLARELYRHWHLNTFAAQAVAARSFACAEHAYFRDRRHFDLTNTASSQEYVGSTADERAAEGTAMTRGLVLGYGGRLVPGYYSSCCGGVAADARDAIGDHPYNDVPPLRGRSGTDVCADAPLFSWSIQRPASDLCKRLRSYGAARGIDALMEIRSLRAIEVSAVNAHGRPRAFLVAADDGVEVELTAEALRRALDYTAEGMSSPDPPLWSSNVRITVSRRGMRIDGHGHGHGVGLCQHGAETLARSGEGHESILAWYYPEVELVQAYETVPIRG